MNHRLLSALAALAFGSVMLQAGKPALADVPRDHEPLLVAQSGISVRDARPGQRGAAAVRDQRTPDGIEDGATPGIGRTMGERGESGVVLRPTPPRPEGLALAGSAESVSLIWYFAASDLAYRFRVQRRSGTGDWTDVHQMAAPSQSGQLGWTDSERSLVFQCYRVVAWSSEWDTAASSSERCTVRPDGSRFPLAVPSSARQWFWDGRQSGDQARLFNDVPSRSLGHDSRSLGIDLRWGSYGNNVRFQRRMAGTQQPIMCGEQIAIQIAGGGWLRHDKRTWGIDLRFANAPQHEWHVLCDQVGAQLPDRIALWNSDKGDFLVYQQRSVGVDLRWHRDTVDDPPVADTSEWTVTVQLLPVPVLEGDRPFSGNLGPFRPVAYLKAIGSPHHNPLLGFPRPGQNCENVAVALAGGQSTTPGQMEQIFGTSRPALDLQNPVPLIACVAASGPNLNAVPVNITYTRDGGS